MWKDWGNCQNLMKAMNEMPESGDAELWTGRTSAGRRVGRPRELWSLPIVIPRSGISLLMSGSYYYLIKCHAVAGLASLYIREVVLVYVFSSTSSISFAPLAR